MKRYVARHFVLTAASLVTAAGAHAATINVEAPVVVQGEIASDIPTYDLCWSDHATQARMSLAADIAEAMSDPASLYVVDLPHFDIEWDRAKEGVPRDAKGEPIRRVVLNANRENYHDDLEEALLDVLAELRRLRPGVRLTLADFDLIAAGVHGGSWHLLSDAVDYVVVPENSTAASQGGGLTAPTGDLRSTANRTTSKTGGRTFESHRPSTDQPEDPVRSHFFENDVWVVCELGQNWILEAGESLPADFPDVPDARREAWENYTSPVVNLLTRQESPFSHQYGPQTYDTLEILPARYEKRETPIIGIPLSFIGIADADPENPRGWRPRYDNIEYDGWSSTLDFYMEQLEEMGYREVWFWGWSGQHEMNSTYARLVMPWFSTDGHSWVMKLTWNQFVNKWKNRGFTFGFWLGGSAIPNFGTTAEPEHRYIQRGDFDYLADTLAEIRNHGFEAVGLDAFKWIMVHRDMPEWANWADNEHGPRDRGIALDLIEHLRNDSRLEGMYICTENRAPYGEYLAAAPTFQLFSSDARPRGNRPTLSTLEPPAIEDIVNPGHEIIMMLSTDGWTETEFHAALDKIEGYGYRPAIGIEVLFEIGYLDRPWEVED